MNIDAHQHFWYYNAEDYDWISDDMSLLRQDFLPRQLQKLLQKNDLQACIAVQARQSLEETDWLLMLAEQYDFIQGVVGWIDLCDPALATLLKKYAHQPKLKGFRHVLQDEPNADFMLQDAFINGLKMLAEYGYSYDLLITEAQLPETVKLVQQLPEMNLVIDHIAKPIMKTGNEKSQTPSQVWLDNMALLASYPHIYCKLSGMITEADWHHWQASDIQPYMSHVLQEFGYERVMFGSDWPVCHLAGTYDQVCALVKNLVKQLDTSENDLTVLKKIMGANAQRFYRCE